MKSTAIILTAALTLPCHAQTQAERLAAAERAIAAAVCGAWKPGAGLTVVSSGDRVVMRGEIHSVIPGRHELHVKGGAVRVFNLPATGFEQKRSEVPGRVTEGYHLISIEAPAGAALEWTRPDGVREPVPTMYLYPAAK